MESETFTPKELQILRIAIKGVNSNFFEGRIHVNNGELIQLREKLEIMLTKFLVKVK